MQKYSKHYLGPDRRTHSYTNICIISFVFVIIKTLHYIRLRSTIPFLKYDFVRPIDYHVMYDHSLNLGRVDHVLDMLEGNVVSAIWSPGIFGG